MFEGMCLYLNRDSVIHKNTVLILGEESRHRLTEWIDERMGSVRNKKKTSFGLCYATVRSFLNLSHHVFSVFKQYEVVFGASIPLTQALIFFL